MLILTINLSGCSFLKPKQEIPVVSCERLPLNLQPVAPLKLDDVNWIIIDAENAENVFSDLKNKNVDVVLFSLTDDDYKSLSINNLSVLNHIMKLRDQLDAYKHYYEMKEAPNVE